MFKIASSNFRSKLKRSISVFVGPTSRKIPAVLHDQLQRIGPEFCVVGDSWASYKFERIINHALRKTTPKNVCIVGCGSGRGRDISSWAEYGIDNIIGTDIEDNKVWPDMIKEISKKYKVKSQFEVMPAENIGEMQQKIDVIYSAAVLEHLAKLSEFISESKRTLSKNGLSIHLIGPLYNCFSGDHCISEYGQQYGYAHIDKEMQKEYQEMIFDDNFFKNTDDPFKAFWAKNKIFSFAGCLTYIDLFRVNFQKNTIGIILSEEGVKFRKKYPEKWQKLLNQGYSELDLLVKGLMILSSNVDKS
jgi:ubiquinone/menaquinone biosynthesis C-methylase UbiE